MGSTATGALVRLINKQVHHHGGLSTLLSETISDKKAFAPYPRETTPVYNLNVEAFLTNQITTGVLPLPPAVIFPTITTGTGAL